MKQLQKAFDALLPTEEQKERMLCEILVARDGAPPKKRRRSNPARVAALLAAALTLTVVTASAAEALGVSQMIRDYFQQKEAVNIMDRFNVAASGLSTTAANGWTITMTDLFGDDNLCYVGVTLEAPEGTVLNRDDYRLDMYALAPGKPLQQETDADGSQILFHGSRNMEDTWFYDEQVADEDPKDNKISFVFRQELQGYVDGTVTNFVFGGLKYVENENADTGMRNVFIVDDFDAKIENVATHFSSNSCRITPNQTIAAFGGKTTLSKLTISPLSISYELSGGSVSTLYFRNFFLSDQYSQMTEAEIDAYLDSFLPTRPERFLSADYPEIAYGWQGVWVQDIPVVLHYKDGTMQELDFEENGHSLNDALEEGRVSASLSFDRLLDLDTIDYITVCDVRIELPAAP